MIDYSITNLPASADGSTAVIAEADVLQAIRDNHLGPFDSKIVSSTTPNPCKLIKVHSDTLAGAASGIDASGNYMVELTRPTSDPGSYDPAKIGDILLTLDTSGSC